MSLRGLLLVLVLPTYHVIAFTWPGRFAHRIHSHLLPKENGRNSGVAVTAGGDDKANWIESVDWQSSAPSESNLLTGTHETVHRLWGIDLQRDFHNFHSSILVGNAEDGINDYSSVLDGTQQEPASYPPGIAIAGLALAFLAFQANNKGNNNTFQAAPNGAYPGKAKELQESVAELSQTVVILTKEIKAIKDTVGRRKVLLLEKQNAALQKELEIAKTHARTLTMKHQDLIKTVEEKYAKESGAAKRESSQTSVVDGKSTDGLFFVEEKSASSGSNQSLDSSHEEEGDYSDLLLLAMGVGTLSALFSNF